MRGSLAILAAFVLLPAAGNADDLYKRNNWSAMSADRRASAVGDLLTVVVYENAESTNSTKTDSKRSTQIGGSVSGGKLNESGSLQIGGGYSGGGAVTRSDKLMAQITVTVRSVLPNGDLMVSGQQSMKLNGENTLIGIEGRIRPEDIETDNRVLSSRIADAKIIYDGKGFVARSAKPGLVARFFRFLGLG
jgi:flagellar L-ring protein precursor FlgH